MVLFVDLAVTSRRVAETTKRSEKVTALASVLADTPPREIEAAVAFGVGETRLGRIGVGWATIGDVRPDPADQPTLAIADVDRVIAEIAEVVANGSVGRSPPRAAEHVVGTGDPGLRSLWWPCGAVICSGSTIPTGQTGRSGDTIEQVPFLLP